MSGQVLNHGNIDGAFSHAGLFLVDRPDLGGHIEDALPFLKRANGLVGIFLRFTAVGKKIESASLAAIGVGRPNLPLKGGKLEHTVYPRRRECLLDRGGEVTIAYIDILTDYKQYRHDAFLLNSAQASPSCAISRQAAMAQAPPTNVTFK